MCGDIYNTNNNKTNKTKTFIAYQQIPFTDIIITKTGKTSYNLVINKNIGEINNTHEITNHNNKKKVIALLETVRTIKTITLNLKNLDKYFKRKDLKIKQTKRFNSYIV